MLKLQYSFLQSAAAQFPWNRQTRQHAVLINIIKKFCMVNLETQPYYSTNIIKHKLHSKPQRAKWFKNGIRLESTSSRPPSEMDKHMRCIKINTCSDLYAYWREADVSRSKPLRGVDFDVVYYDSKPEAASSVPVIVALHGTAASHLHFAPLLPYLKDTGARILVPNFPGCGYTALDKERAFSHTDQERASFVSDFLNTLNISRVDVLIVHSAGIYPALYCLNDVDRFQSIVLLNPSGHRVKQLQPIWLFQFLMSLTEIRLVRCLFGFVAPIILKRFPGMNLSSEELQVAARSFVFVNFDYVKDKLLELKLRRFPMIFSYAMDDKIVGADVFEEMVEILQFNSDDIVRYNAEGLAVQSELISVQQKKQSCIVFECGGHFVMKTHPEIVGKAISELLKWIESRPAVVVFK